MALLIVAPLEASRLDLGRIEAIRRRYDPNHAVIAAHVSLVFPFETPDADTAAIHLAGIAEGRGAIALRLSAYLAVRDFDDRRSHVFLVPDQGRTEVEDLHDALYSGPLAGQFRIDIPFIPHVTVAARDHHDEAEDLVRELGKVGIAGRLPRLDLIAFDGGEVTVLGRFPLQARRRPDTVPTRQDLNRRPGAAKPGAMTDTPPTFRSELRETLFTVGYALAIALALRVILFEPVTIPSASMEPGLQEGDYLVVSKFDYGWSHASIPLNPPLPGGRLFGHAPRRGDVVVFRLPRDPKIDYIKRVIGLPGDRIQLVHGTVLVNGVPNRRTPMDRVTDPTSPEVTVTRIRETNAEGRSYITFDRGPDHDGDDTDVYRVPQGYYFMLGDNRDNSLDSRWPSEIGVGLVPAENLVGRGRFILLSWRQGAAIFKPWTWLNLDPARFFRALT